MKAIVENCLHISGFWIASNFPYNLIMKQSLAKELRTHTVGVDDEAFIVAVSSPVWDMLVKRSSMSRKKSSLGN